MTVSMWHRFYYAIINCPSYIVSNWIENFIRQAICERYVYEMVYIMFILLFQMGRPIAKLVSGDEQPRLLENPREWQPGLMAIALGKLKVQNLSQRGE